MWNGKGYDINNKISYEIKDGKGFIKEYNYYGKLIFEGVFSNGNRNGKGKIYHNNILKFEGEYLNGEKIGTGKEYHENSKLKFEGGYLKIWIK